MKKKKVLIIVGIVAVVLIAAILVWYFIWGKNKSVNNQEFIVKIETSAGQEVVFAQLTSVKGNEITYTVAEEAEETSSEEMPAMPEGFEGGERPAMPEGFGNGEMPAGPDDFEGGEMPARPEGFSGGFQTMPDVSGNEGMPQRPEGFKGGERPAMPGGQGDDVSSGNQMIGGGRGGQGGRGGNRGNATEGGRGGRGGMAPGGNFGAQGAQSTYAFSYDDTNYQLAEESRTELIPVGTEVITKLGTVTTFSRLAAGDNVALVVEKEDDEQVIVAVYIIG